MVLRLGDTASARDSVVENIDKLGVGIIMHVLYVDQRREGRLNKLSGQQLEIVLL